MKKTLLLLLGIAFIFMGCATVPKKPAWVTKGAGVFGDRERAFYGVGIAENIPSEALRRTTADNRALAEIARSVSVVVTTLMKDYMSSTSVVEDRQTSSEQYIEDTSKYFSSQVLSGAKIIDRWDNGKTAYSLAKLPLNDLNKVAEQEAGKLSRELKEYIKRNAEKAFENLSKEK